MTVTAVILIIRVFFIDLPFTPCPKNVQPSSSSLFAVTAAYILMRQISFHWTLVSIQHGEGASAGRWDWWHLCLFTVQWERRNNSLCCLQCTVYTHW